MAFVDCSNPDLATPLPAQVKAQALTDRSVHTDGRTMTTLHSDRKGTKPGLRLAVMQPYLLPYIGYFQLMAAVDRFVLFDDVNYIQRGWINRNRILLDGRPHRFTLPLRGASQNRRICEIERMDDPSWAPRLLRIIHQAYGRAPYYAAVAPLLERILGNPAVLLADYLRHSLEAVHNHLGLGCELVPSSRVYGNAALRGQDRILDICLQEGAEFYINAIGGAALYDCDAFGAQGVSLRFLRSHQTNYPQWGDAHLPWLSIIDALMFNSISELRRLLCEHDLLSSPSIASISPT